MSAQTETYYFGGIKEFNLEQIETEVLNESLYLDVFAGSDFRLKKEIQPLQGALAKVIQLEGVTYLWDQTKIPAHWGKASEGKVTGLIAQEVAAVIPEAVRSDRESGFLAVDYAKMTSYLVEAVKELHQRIQVLEAELDRSKSSKNG